MKSPARVWFVAAFGCLFHSALHAGPTVLLIGKEPDHPHGTHMYMHVCKVLAKALESNVDGLQTRISSGWPTDGQMLEGVDAIVVYADPAAELLLQGPHREKFAKLMADGVGLTTIHWASSIRQQNFEDLGPTWLSVLGGTWISNVGLHTGKSQLVQLRPDHPVHRGWQGYEIHDEYYLNPTLTDDATPLLQVTVDDAAVVVGWAYERSDGGRSFATTLGHFYANFQQPQFRKMLVNGILWTAKEEVPASGADADVPEELLTLPPK